MTDRRMPVEVVHEDAPQPVSVAPSPAGPAPAHAVVAALGRAAGNFAVARMLEGRVEPPGRPCPRIVARFGSREHAAVGADASDGATTDIDLGGEMLPYGDMVALAGDFFGSLDEMRRLAASPPGQEELRGTRVSLSLEAVA